MLNKCFYYKYYCIKIFTEAREQFQAQQTSEIGIITLSLHMRNELRVVNWLSQDHTAVNERHDIWIQIYFYGVKQQWGLELVELRTWIEGFVSEKMVRKKRMNLKNVSSWDDIEAVLTKGRKGKGSQICLIFAFIRYFDICLM